MPGDRKSDRTTSLVPALEDFGLILCDTPASHDSDRPTGALRLWAAFVIRTALYALRRGPLILNAWKLWRLQRLLARCPEAVNVYYAATIQQRRALAKIIALDSRALVIGSKRGEGTIVLTRSMAAIRAFALLPGLCRLFASLDTAGKRWFVAHFERLMPAAGFFALWQSIFAVLKPRCLVLASDHVLTTRAAIASARRAGVPSVYIQHGCVSPSFPPLAMDYALLDGRYSFDVYAAKGLGHTRVSLIGIPRLSGARVRQAAPLGGPIGICTNELTPVETVLETIHWLRAHFPERRLVLRLHPRQFARQALRRRFEGLVELSDSRREEPEDFLAAMDVIVAGSSTILLEAALLGVLPLYLRWFDVYTNFRVRDVIGLDDSRADFDDYYGFIARGVCLGVRDFGELERALTNDTDRNRLRASAKHFCDTVNTPHDFRSAELALRCIALAGDRRELPFRWE
ncbi:MAG TPA: hypothetical protein VNL72_03330 [Gammaproteobacteria bacterium]|nr:hypothetical protein [Gammaproteobacteria bacterium]